MLASAALWSLKIIGGLLIAVSIVCLILGARTFELPGVIEWLIES